MGSLSSLTGRSSRPPGRRGTRRGCRIPVPWFGRLSTSLFPEGFDGCKVPMNASSAIEPTRRGSIGIVRRQALGLGCRSEQVSPDRDVVEGAEGLLELFQGRRSLLAPLLGLFACEEPAEELDPIAQLLDLDPDLMPGLGIEFSEPAGALGHPLPALCELACRPLLDSLVPLLVQVRLVEREPSTGLDPCRRGQRPAAKPHLVQRREKLVARFLAPPLHGREGL